MRKIACLTLDVEADFLDPTGRIRLLEDDALLNRYLGIIQIVEEVRQGVPDLRSRLSDAKMFI